MESSYINIGELLDTEIRLDDLWGIITDEKFFDKLDDIIYDYDPDYIEDLLSEHVSRNRLIELRDMLDKIINGTTNNF